MSRVIVSRGNIDRSLSAVPQQSLLDCLRSAGYDLPAPCGGNGRCGKCRLEIMSEKGRETVLACRYIPRGDISLVLPERMGGQLLGGDDMGIRPLPPREGLGLALDLGTTSLAASLYDLETGDFLGTKAEWCVLGSYGSDVLSRCRHAMERGTEEMCLALRRQAMDMGHELKAKSGSSKEIKEIYAAGNTVMEHIFAGLDPSGLGIAPFEGESLFRRFKAMELEGAEIHLAPCAASYVGGDIMAGLMASGFTEQPGCRLFLDLGTNGEMALIRDGQISSCAVACGPAFEGAGISCGMASMPGAVEKLSWSGSEPEALVIGGGEAKGICGSGLISIAALLLEKGLIDGGGRLLPPEEAAPGFEKWLGEDERGNGVFSLGSELELRAEDVRALQLAKAAVAAGIELLLETQSLEPEEIDELCLAGGFSMGLDLSAAAKIGLLPESLAEKARLLGNSSLRGAALALMDMGARETLERLADNCLYMDLSGDRGFDDAFIDHMSFFEEEEGWN